ncbi:MAG: hypothetical protein AAF384_15315 [Pseudomonadota bacterium]
MELLYGERGAHDFSGDPLCVSHGDDLILNDVSVIYSLYELPMAVARERLPASLHPSVPAVLGVTGWNAPDSTFGAFEFAYLGLACRTGIKPRHLIYGAFCNNPKAAEFLSNNYGFSVQHAEVAIREYYDRATLQIGDAQAPLLTHAITNMIPIVGAGAAVKYSPPLNVCTIEDQTVLAQFEAGYDFKKVMRGTPELSVFEGEQLGDPWAMPTTPVSGTQAVCDIQLLPVRFKVDLEIPAESGGARKISA